MRALFDVNVLIALVDPRHMAHQGAREWLSLHLSTG